MDTKVKRTTAVRLFCLGAFAALREILGIRVLLPLGLSDTFNRKTLDIRRRLLLQRFKLLELGR